jgi:TolB-like protein
MKKNIIATVLLIGINCFIQAQEKTDVGIMPFSYVQGAASFQDANSIQETVTNAFVKTKRFNIVDRSKMDALKKEKELQKTEDFIDGNVIEQGVSLGAKHLVSGRVTSVSKFSGYRERSKLDGTKVSQLVNEAKINFTCQIIDVETGLVINSETFSANGGGAFLGLSMAKNIDDAFSSSLSSLERDIDRWVGTNFPAIFSIAEIQEKDSKGDAKMILIAGGSAFGLEKGDKLKVVELIEMEVNGKRIQRKKEIGELKITKVEDENFSICSVKEGGIDINAKFEANSNLQIMTKK